MPSLWSLLYPVSDTQLFGALYSFLHNFVFDKHIYPKTVVNSTCRTDRKNSGLIVKHTRTVYKILILIENGEP